MDKGDWYFATSTFLAIIGLLGIDWKLVWGKIPVPRLNRQIIFFVLIIASLAVSLLGWYQSNHLDLLHWRMKQADEQVISGQTFRNESVEIDGKKFDHCKFESVTLVYHSLAPADFVECQWTGTIYLKTDNDAAKGFMALVEGMRNGPQMSLFKLGGVDNHGNIVPIAPGIPVDRSPGK